MLTKVQAHVRKGGGSSFCDWGWREGGVSASHASCCTCWTSPDEYMHFIHRRGEAVRVGVPARIMAKKGWGCQGNFRIVVGSGFLSVYFVYFTAQGLIIVVACGIFSCGVWGLVP